MVAGRSHRHTLVQGHDIPELRVVEQRVEDGALRGPGIAEDVADPVTNETLHEDVLATHMRPPLPRRGEAIDPFVRAPAPRRA